MTSLSEKVARQRDAKAALADRMARLTIGCAWAATYRQEAADWRAAAERARAGDLTPFRPATLAAPLAA